MRVLFVTGEYPSMQGGVGDYTRRLGQALCRLGADVSVLTHVDAGGDPLRTPAGDYEPAVYPMLTGGGGQLWRQTLALIRQLQPDVVHIQYQSAAFGLRPAVNYLPWLLHSLWARRLPRRPAVFTTFHDLRVPYMFPKAGPLRRRAVLALAARSDVDIVTNPADWAEMAAAAPGLAVKMRAIPIASNISPGAPPDYDRARQRERWGVGPRDWLLAYFGFLNAGKGGETLMQALAELVAAGMPASLLMIGGQVGSSDPTNQAYLAHVEALIRTLGLSDRVRWTGFTSDQEVTANLLAADCAVLPYREGASLRHGSLMAALTHGLPIVTTSVPHGREVDEAAQAHFPRLRDGQSVLLVTPGDPAALANAVTRVMSEPALQQRLATGAADLSREFQWDTIARQHLAIYRV